MTTATKPGKPTHTASVRMSAGLPKPEHCGIDVPGLIAKPKAKHYAVVQYDVARLIDDVDDESRTAVIRLLAFETIDADADYDLSSIIAQYAEDRTGQAKLPNGDED